MKIHKWLQRQANISKNGADNVDGGESATSELGLLVYWPSGVSISDKDFINGNTRLAELRRYILIITDNLPPTNAYVSHFERGIWYYIDGADLIFQKNFELVSLFLTMMAVPSTTPPITPTISVGGT